MRPTRWAIARFENAASQIGEVPGRGYRSLQRLYPVDRAIAQGQMKPGQAEIERLRREVQKLKAERDILKKAAAYFAKDHT